MEISSYEPSKPEFQKNAELTEVAKFREVASQIGNDTGNMLENETNSGQNFIERIWYRHNATLLILEAAAIKTLAVLYPELRIGGKIASSGLAYKGFDVGMEDVKGTSKEKMPVGKHMDILLDGKFRSLTSKKLTDGSTIQPGAKIGIIDFARDIPKLDKQDSLIGFTKQLYKSGEESLQELAALCEANDPRLEGTNYFYGMSHLAGPLAKRLGFDVFDIADPVKKFGLKYMGKKIAEGVAKENVRWQGSESNFKDPREAFISRQKLVELYGKRSKEPYNFKRIA